MVIPYSFNYNYLVEEREVFPIYNIQNINQRLKTYAILGGVYRRVIDGFEKMTKITQVASTLCNMNLDKHPIRK